MVETVVQSWLTEFYNQDSQIFFLKNFVYQAGKLYTSFYLLGS